MSSRGSIQQRGRTSWRIRFDVPNDLGKRKQHEVTFRGTGKEAQKELTRLLAESDKGTLADPSKVTVAEHVRDWIKRARVSPRTREGYSDVCELRIVPHLGTVKLQKLRPVMIEEWHTTLLERGSKAGGPLSAQTVQHAHRLLHVAIKNAVRNEVLARNVVAIHSAPAVTPPDIDWLTQDQIPVLLAKLDGHALMPIAVLALATGMRRGEVLALRWRNLDLEALTVTIEESLEQTRGGLRFKPPKTKAGMRTLRLPAGAAAVLRQHRARQSEIRLRLGLGSPENDGLVFYRWGKDGKPVPIPPNDLSRDWARAVKALDAPKVSFHGLRHTVASLLIAGGHDVVAVARHLGHKDATVTLKRYAHFFKAKDDTAAALIGAALALPVANSVANSGNVLLPAP
ncbi:MAG TPA: site-specific integrase [Gemmataceae bacterium]|jgi:integrase